MELIRSLVALRSRAEEARASARTVGLVPTMGALHAGHASLVQRAARECGAVVVTLFVNPLQFGPSEDLATYPRDLATDSVAAAGAGATHLFAPDAGEMYPSGFSTSVRVAGPTEVLEGDSRPGHFEGVTTVVAKLLAATGPCRAYLGEKDFQQLVVVRRMVADLSLPAEVVGCPIVREADGLALSSRNARLGETGRSPASALWRSLRAGRDLVESGEQAPGRVRSAMGAILRAEPLVSVGYAEVVDPETLMAPESIEGEVRLLVAATVGGTRLIDNVAACGPSG
ncbi:MAG: pantoate--beta-alanine ligase [Acidimicrobiales bacterium]